jgi:hypothetical protein
VRLETDLSRDGLTGTADLVFLAREWRHEVELPTAQAVPPEDDALPGSAATVE